MAVAIVLAGGSRRHDDTRRYDDADLTALAHRINDPARYAAPGGGLFSGRTPEGFTCSDECRFICPGNTHSSAAEVDLTRNRVRVDRLVVNDYDPPLTTDDLDKIIAGEIVAKMGECLYG